MKRNHEIRVRVSKEELDILKVKANTLGIPISIFLRTIGLKANLIVEK